MSINDERTDQKYTNKEISSHKNSAEMIDHKLDDNGINLVNIEEEADVISTHSMNETNNIYMNDDEKYIYKYSVLFLLSKNHEDVSSGSEYDSAKRRFFHRKNIVLDL